VGREVTARRKLYATIAMLAAACIACFLAASLELSESGQMAGIDSAESGEQARFALELIAIGMLNLAATVAFVLRQSKVSSWALMVLQVAILVAAFVQGIVTDIGWFYFCAMPLFTLLALLALRATRTGHQPVFLILAAVPAVLMVAVASRFASAEVPTVSVTSHPIPLPSGLALICTDNYRSDHSMGPLEDGNYVHYVCDHGKVLAWWIDRDAGNETAPPA
jgi:hypothetical protein